MSSDSDSFVRKLAVADPPARQAALQTLLLQLRAQAAANGGEESKGGAALSEEQVSLLCRVAVEAPFPEVRSALQDFLRETGCDSTLDFCPEDFSVSLFIPRAVLSFEAQNATASSILQDIFLETGHISNLERVLCLHPHFFEVENATFNTVMYEPGPLPYHWRTFIAVVASARHHCTYLVKQQEVAFLDSGGDESWLSSLSHIPRKLAKLLHVNQLLAHQPWLLSKDHIQDLCHGEDSWSVAELVHAMVVMTTFHGFAGLVWACGINEDVEFALQSSTEHHIPATSSEEDLEALFGNPSDPASIQQETAKLTNQLRAGRRTQQQDSDDAMAMQTKLFEEAANEDFNQPPQSVRRSSMSKRYCGGFTMQYQDFDIRADNYKVFRVQDYSWKDQGYDLMSQFYEQAVGLLDREFDFIVDMTDGRVNDQVDVDTAPFRRALWFYTQRVFGILHDDYNYREVNDYVCVPLKQFCKKIVSLPETIAQRDFLQLGLDLLPHEKCHIALIVVEARRQASLLYGLRAIMHHMYD